MVRLLGRRLAQIARELPELVEWDDRALIGALADYQSKVLESPLISTGRQQEFLDWVRLSCLHGAPLNAMEFGAMALASLPARRHGLPAAIE